MKKNRTIWLWLIALCCLFAACKKDKTDEEQLPAATQTGANTFGCLINGKIYTPKGFEQNQPNFNMIVDPGFNDGNLDIRTFRKLDSKTSSINFSSDSIKNLGIYQIGLNSRLGFYYYQLNEGNSVCETLSRFTYGSSGYLKITHYDLLNRIISGEFEFQFPNPNCGIGDPIHITQGRFDKKF
jgi:hypothetical protein